MEADMLQAVRSHFTSDAVERLGAHFGASVQATQGVLSRGIPLVVGGLTRQAQSRVEAERLISGLPTSGPPMDFLPPDTGLGAFGERGQGILQMIFGDHLPAVINSVASSSGATLSATKGLLGVVAVLSVNHLGRHVSEHQLGADGLMQYLSAQRDRAAELLPPDLRRFTSSRPETHVGRGLIPRRERVAGEGRTPNVGRAVFVLALVLAVIAGAFALRNWRNRTADQREDLNERQARTPPVSRPTDQYRDNSLRPPAGETDQTVTPGTLVAPGTGGTGEMGSPGSSGTSPVGSPGTGGAGTSGIPPAGTQGNVPPTGPLSLAAVLSSPAPALPEQRFPLDKLQFDKGVATLPPASNDSLQEIATALRDHPNARVRILAAGDLSPSGRTELGQARADSIKQDLVRRGASDQQIVTEAQTQNVGKLQPGKAEVVLLAK